MAVAYVQPGTQYGGGYTFAITLTSVALDSLLVLFVSGINTQTVTGVDTTGSVGATGTWTQAGTRSYGNTIVEIWYAVCTTAGNISVKPTGTANDAGYSLHEYSGCATSSIQDGSGQYDDISLTDTSFSTGTIATSVSDSLLVAIWANESADKTVTWTDYTQRTNVNSHVHKTADRILTTTGTYGCAGSHDAIGGNGGVALMACFKGVAAGGNPEITVSETLVFAEALD